MNTSTTIAIATSSSNSAAVAAQQAAEKAGCRMTLKYFEADDPTPEQMREYADCIDLLHPSPMTGTEIFAMKIIVFLALVGAGIGGWFAKNDHLGSWVEWIMYPAIGALVTPAVGVFAAALLYGAWWLFTGG